MMNTDSGQCSEQACFCVRLVLQFSYVCFNAIEVLELVKQTLSPRLDSSLCFCVVFLFFVDRSRDLLQCFGGIDCCLCFLFFFFFLL